MSRAFLGAAFRFTSVAAFAAFTCAIGCSVIATSDLGVGIGFVCTADSECQGKVCNAGVCASRCTVDAECPLPSSCINSLCRVGSCRDDASCGKGSICEATACKAGCRDDNGCNAGEICNELACKVACRDDKGCTEGKICRDGACQATLKIAAVFSGAIDGQDGWTTSHKIGLDVATKAYPDVRYGDASYAFKQNVKKAEDITKAIDQYAGEGASVIITTSPVGTDAAIQAAPKYPNVKFIAAGARKNGGLTNVGAYAAKTEQAWYVAGRLAGRVSDRGKKCVGIILPTPTRELIRDTNAFIRGVRRQVPDGKVVIRWLGGGRDLATSPSYSYKSTNNPATATNPAAPWFDSANDGLLFREELLAAQIADLGCTLVANRTDTQRSVLAVEKRFKIPVKNSVLATTLFSMGVDTKDACRAALAPDGEWFPSCLGSTFWNWSGVYSKVLDQVKRDVWKGLLTDELFRSDASAIIKFELSPFPTVTGIDADASQGYLIDAADKGFDAVFTGPYKFTGQRDLDRDGNADANQTIGAGELVSAEELNRMCWFVDGAVELPDPTVVTYESLIPAMVPYGPTVAGQTSTLNESFAADKKKYGDVIQFVKSNSEDPQTVMSCTLH